jgi:hypothetical protein
MTLRDAVAALVAAAPPDATIPVRWLAEQLDAEALPAPAIVDTSVDLDVQQLAALFGRSASTIRTWIERGVFADCYRLRGREWRVPRASVAAMQRAAAQQKPTAKPSTPLKATPIGAWRDHLPEGSQRAS